MHSSVATRNCRKMYQSLDSVGGKGLQQMYFKSISSFKKKQKTFQMDSLYYIAHHSSCNQTLHCLQRESCASQAWPL